MNLYFKKKRDEALKKCITKQVVRESTERLVTLLSAEVLNSLEKIVTNAESSLSRSGTIHLCYLSSYSH